MGMVVLIPDPQHARHLRDQEVMHLWQGESGAQIGDYQAGLQIALYLANVIMA